MRITHEDFGFGGKTDLLKLFKGYEGKSAGEFWCDVADMLEASDFAGDRFAVACVMLEMMDEMKSLGCLADGRVEQVARRFRAILNS